MTKLEAREALRAEATKRTGHNLGGKVLKDIQTHLRHSQPDTTANEYMRYLPESVVEMVGAVYEMLMKGGKEKTSSEDLLPTLPTSSKSSL